MLYPPPGQMMTAAPVSLSLAGRNTESVGLLTLLMRLTPLDASIFSSGTGLVSPGALPGQTLRVSGLSSVRAKDTAASTIKGARPMTKRFISVLLRQRCRLPLERR
jgi:hypothetical protein